MQTTLNKIKQHTPCSKGWEKLLKFLNKTKSDDEPIELLTILESNGLDDALWALRAVDGFDREIRLMACDFAELVVHLANDERSAKAIEVSRRYANGQATIEELNTAREDARAAGEAAWEAAREAAWDAAWEAAWDAASDAAMAAARAAREAAWDAASDAAMAASYAASDAAEKEKQIEIFIKYAKN